MGQIIAETYEILEKIGSGGGGIVYLGRHLRLGKMVVLKADKRRITARPEVLRREVDALKNLSHTYIPQVYDFLVDEDVVYTVMDYIEGESLDRVLERKEKFPQAAVVEWACQLLEALVYLHTRPPHGILHSDIKPANIMLTPQGNICLIDFNIALALGEDGAVKVGLSRGYASPEHYGLDYSAAGETCGVGEDAGATQIGTGAETVIPDGASSSGFTDKRVVQVDVRSDIYSAGATLYHLFTGRRPAVDAKHVEPIRADEVSPAIAAILERAMEPDPDRRYQTAAEMLHDFEHLHENDPRSIRHRRCVRLTAGLLTALFLAGGCTAFVGLKQLEGQKNALAQAEYSAAALREGDVREAVDLALAVLPEKPGLLGPPRTPQAQCALTNALGVYDLTDGFKAVYSLKLESEPIKLALSPGGSRAAVLTSGQVTVFRTDTGEHLAELAAEDSALSDLVFSGENLLYYAGESGVRAYDLAAGRELWKGQEATALTLSGDGSILAAVNRDESVAAVYDAATGTPREAITFHNKHQSVPPNDRFADPEDALFTLDGTGRWLAASFSDGSLRLFDLRDSENDLEVFDTSIYTHFEGGFYGNYFAFTATGDGESVFAVLDLVDMAQTGGFSAQTPFHVRVHETGIYLSSENILVRIDPVTGEQQEVAYTGADISAFATDGQHTLTAVTDGTLAFFDEAAQPMGSHSRPTAPELLALTGDVALEASRDTPAVRVSHLETYPDAQIFTYDPAYLHHEARLSADGSTVMLFRYDGFRLLDRESGAILAEVQLPQAEQVYDQQYRRNERGSYLEVIYNDGLTRCYSAADGSLLSEVPGKAPDLSLYEEFTTDHWRITSPLHGTPEIFDLKTGEKLGELEKDTYLTYVTQVDSLVITEYITAQGARYGLLLDETGATLARMPGLCDVTADHQLVFDDSRGTMRQTRIYSLQELLALAETDKEGNL